MERSRKTSKFIGVSFDRLRNKFSSEIKVNNKKIHLGRFNSETDAAIARDKFIVDNRIERKLNFYVVPESSIPNTKLIQLTQNKFAIVDNEDFDKVNNFIWFAIKDNGNWYAGRNYWRNNKRLTQTMHSFILGCGSESIDHRNGNGLHNYKSNLRICSVHENSMNKKPLSNCSSKYKGVSFHKKIGKFKSSIGFNYHTNFLGYFDDEIDAAKAYDSIAKELFGEFARLNFNH